MLCVGFAGLGVLGALSLAASALPPMLAAPFALLAFWHGLHLACSEWRRDAYAVVLDGHGGAAMIRGGEASEAISGAELFLRGPLTLLAWRDAGGARKSLLWFADTLPASSRRRLRLHFGAGGAAALA